jgi:hypothetical protein
MPTYPQLPQSTLPRADWFASSHDEIQFAYWVPKPPHQVPVFQGGNFKDARLMAEGSPTCCS